MSFETEYRESDQALHALVSTTFAYLDCLDSLIDRDSKLQKTDNLIVLQDRLTNMRDQIYYQLGISTYKKRNIRIQIGQGYIQAQIFLKIGLVREGWETMKQMSSLRMAEVEIQQLSLLIDRIENFLERIAIILQETE